jgi:hypothetical protein
VSFSFYDDIERTQMNTDKIIHEAVHKYLRRREVEGHCQAQGLPITDARLRRLAYEGRGPKFCYFGRYPMYREDWVSEWIAKQLSTVTTKTNGHRRREPRAA